MLIHAILPASHANCGLNHSFAALESYLCRWMTGQALDFSSALARSVDVLAG